MKTKISYRLLALTLVVSMALPLMGQAFSYAESPPISPVSCPVEEHTHSDECYLIPGERTLSCTVETHKHFDSCYDEEGNIICGYSDKILHQHDELCYDNEGEMICNLPEYEPHTHTYSCYSFENELVCEGGTSDFHEHTDDCFETIEVNVCGLEEDEFHVHDETCVDIEQSLVCEIPTEVPEHVHDESCYQVKETIACGMQDLVPHTHDISCFDFNNNFICGQLEVIEHQHNDECFISDGDEIADTPQCGKLEHTHSDICTPPDDSSEDPDEDETEIDGVIEDPVDIDLSDVPVDFDQISGWDFGLFTNASQHGVHITDFYIADIVDGTAPFDNHMSHSVGAGCYKLVCERAHTHSVEDNCYALVCTSNIYEGVPEDISYPGDDRNWTNNIVRTFDSVNYTFHVDVVPTRESVNTNDVRVKLKVYLDAAKDEAGFNLDAMTWMDETPGYEPKVEVVKIDGITYQVLTCYKYLADVAYNRVNFTNLFFEENITIDVKNMKNGDNIRPVFFAVPEGGCEYDLDEAPQPISDEYEKISLPDGSFHYKYDYDYDNWYGGYECKFPTYVDYSGVSLDMIRADAPGMTISAAPKYNIELNANGGDLGQFDFADLANGSEEPFYGENLGLQSGRLVRVGLNVQLYNDNPAKGLKGIELPKVDEEGRATEAVEFDIDISSVYSPYENNDRIFIDGNNYSEYLPILYSVGLDTGNSTYGRRESDGRPIYNTNNGSNMIPYSKGGNWNSVYDSGKWYAYGDENDYGKRDVVHVRIENLIINMDKMPTHKINMLQTSSPAFDKNIGTISSGLVWFIQPFNPADTSNADKAPVDHLDGDLTVTDNIDGSKTGIFKIGGSGEFQVSFSVGNIHIESKSGTVVKNPETEVINPISEKGEQFVYDNHASVGLGITPKGSMSNYIAYTTANGKGVGVDNTEDGRDFAVPGSEIWITGGFNYSPSQSDANTFYYGTNFSRFYGRAIELDEIDYPGDGWLDINPRMNGTQYNVPDTDGALKASFSLGVGATKVKVYYAAKPNGLDWGEGDDIFGLMEGYNDALKTDGYNDSFGDYEMKNVTEENMLFFDTLSDLRAELGEDAYCVGMLYCIVGPSNPYAIQTSNVAYRLRHKAKIRDDFALLGDTEQASVVPMVYQLVSTSKVWSRANFENDSRYDEITQYLKNNSAFEESDSVVPTEDFLRVFRNTLSEQMTSPTVSDFAYLESLPNNFLRDANIKNGSWYRKTEYYKDGRGVKYEHNSDWGWLGDTILIIGYQAQIEKTLLQKQVNGRDEKKDFNLDSAQRIVDFKLKPNLIYTAPQGSSFIGSDELIADVVVITDVLPKYLTYIPGSAHLGDENTTYQQTNSKGGTQGNIVGTVDGEYGFSGFRGINGGYSSEMKNEREYMIWEINLNNDLEITDSTAADDMVNDPEIMRNDGGTQTLVWKFYNVPIKDGVMPDIYYSAAIGDQRNTDNDVQMEIGHSTVELVNKVYISATLDRRDHGMNNHNYSEEGIKVVKGKSGAYGKYASNEGVEPGDPISYTVYYNNNGKNAIEGFALADTMPSMVPGTATDMGNNFEGSYSIANTELSLVCDNIADIGNIQIYYTTLPEFAGKTMTEEENRDRNTTFSKEEVTEENGWKLADIGLNTSVNEDSFVGDVNFGVAEGEMVTAWVIKGELSEHTSLEVTMKIQTTPDKLNENLNEATTEKFVNILSVNNKTTIVQTSTVKRSLEGVAWIDADRDGLRDDGEDMLDDVQVQLFKLTENGNADRLSDYEPFIYTGTDGIEKMAIVHTGWQLSVKTDNVTAYTGVDNMDEDDDVAYGRYRFTDLPEGVYAVKFLSSDSEHVLDDGSPAFKIDSWKSTLVDVNPIGSSDVDYDIIDSDASPYFKGEDDQTLDFTAILNIDMTASPDEIAAKFRDGHFVSANHDSGFYSGTVLRIEKYGPDTNIPLSGATFTMQQLNNNDVVEAQVSFRPNADMDGYEAVLGSDTFGGEGKYYQIGFIGGEDTPGTDYGYVIGSYYPSSSCDCGDDNVGLNHQGVQLQKRITRPSSENDSAYDRQLWEIIRLSELPSNVTSDHSNYNVWKDYAVVIRNKHTGLYLNLHLGGVGDGTPVHLWNKVTEAGSWIIESNKDRGKFCYMIQNTRAIKESLGYWDGVEIDKLSAGILKNPSMEIKDGKYKGILALKGNDIHGSGNIQGVRNNGTWAQRWYIELADAENLTESIVMPNSNAATITGLMPGKYQLDEKTPPDGFKAYENPVVINISQSGEITVDSDPSDAVIEIVSHRDDDETVIKIQNEEIPGRLLELPNTGGMGTLPVLIAALPLAAGIILALRTKRNRKEI